MLGVVSFFTDISAHMIYPLIPLFLVQTLGATPMIPGIIEGIAETTASVLKVFSGFLSDRYKKRKLLIPAGYGISSFLRPLIGFAGSRPRDGQYRSFNLCL
jgi:MFS family permease